VLLNKQSDRKNSVFNPMIQSKAYEIPLLQKFIYNLISFINIRSHLLYSRVMFLFC